MKRIRVMWLFVCLVAMLFSPIASALDYDFEQDNQLDDWVAQGAGNGGEWSIEDGELVATLVGYQDLFLKGSETWTDYTVEFRGRLLNGRILGLAFRYTDTNNNYRLNLYEDLDATNNLYVYVRVNGTFAEVMKVGVGQIDKDTWYQLKIEVEGNTIRAYLDGDLKIEAEHDAHPEGGIAFEGETNTQAHFDDLQVEGEGIAPSAVSPAGKLSTVWAQMRHL